MLPPNEQKLGPASHIEWGQLFEERMCDLADLAHMLGTGEGERPLCSKLGLGEPLPCASFDSWKMVSHPCPQLPHQVLADTENSLTVMIIGQSLKTAE